MQPARRAVPLLAVVAIASMAIMDVEARAASSQVQSFQDSAAALVSEALSRFTAWVETGYARRPALMIGLGTAFAVPVLVLAGVFLHSVRIGRLGDRYDVAAGERPDFGPPVTAARLALDGRSAIMLPAGRDLVQIGRLGDNDICIEDDSVQHYHAVIERHMPEGFSITDVSGLGGEGLRINGAPCASALLVHGDLVELGRTRMRFEVQH